MSEQLPKPIIWHHHAQDMARKAMEHLSYGFMYDPEPKVSDIRDPETFYTLDPFDCSASLAQLAVRRLERPDPYIHKPEDVLSNSRALVSRLEMGHYDPAQKRWIVYRDFIGYEDQFQLENHFALISSVERELMDFEIQHGSSQQYFDYWNEATETMRYQTRQLLLDSGLHVRLIKHNPLPTLRDNYRTDSYTTSYLSIISEETAGKTRDTLMANYRGLFPVHRPDERKSMRIPIARRTGGEGQQWQPNQSMMANFQWFDYLAFAPHMLELHKTQHPAFSLARCAMRLSAETV